MRTKTEADVIVVGGGPAGASTAFALAHAGARVLLLDRATFPRDKPCAEYLSPQASRLLSAMGALEEVERSAAHLAGMIVRAPNGALIRGDFVASHGYRAFRDRGLALRRTKLDPILLDCARRAGAEVREGARVGDVLRDGSGRVKGVSVLDAAGMHRELLAPLVVGADGLRSVVGRRLQLMRARRWPRRLALVAHYEGFAGVGAWGEMHVERDVGYVGLAYIKAEGIKVIPVDGIEVSDETVRNGKYPYARETYFYTNGAPAGETKDFIDFTVGEEGQKIARQVGFVPIK